MQRYLLAQFLAAVIAILWIGTVFAAEGARAVLLPCALLWFSLYVLGLLNDRRPSAIRTEQWRLTAVVPPGVALLYYSGLVPVAASTLVAATAAYVAISWFGLQRARACGEQHIAHAT